MSKILKGFKDFIFRGNAVELAVGVVFGAAFNTMIQAIVKDLLTPLVGALTRIPDFSILNFTLNSSKFMIGELINAMVSFLLISVAIYFFVIIPMNTYRTKIDKKPASTKKCPECLSEIPAEAKRCAHCGQKLKK